jgi:hypothetical protein
MNLAWLAAVLQPNDVAPHPNFADDEYDSGGPPRLAAIVLGDPWRSHRAAELAEKTDDDDLVTLAERCLRTDTIAVSVATLAGRLTGPRPGDLAQTAALALIASSAAAELDDYGTCLRVLDAQLRWTSKNDVSDDALRRAALLQQKALRLRDAGQQHLPTTVEAAAALSHLDVERCSSFRTSPGISWSSRTTIEQIRGTLVDAAASLIPTDATDVAEAAGLPTWQERVRTSAPSVAVRTARNDAETYAKYVEQVFARQFRSQARSIGEPARPDLFDTVLALELVGHGGVFPARKELALLRLVQTGEPEELADALRLLRHAAAKNELDLALGRLRAAGPLAVLSDDARQVLRTRTAPELLRTVEMRVLHIAAELLAPAEARVALDAVRASLAAGGPPDLPGRWELLVLRKEIAWAAAVALGNACDAAGQVAELLLNEAEKEQQGDQLLDRALLRATAEIEWTEVPQRIQVAWTELLNARNADLPGTAEMVFARLGRSAPILDSSAPLDALRHGLNTAIGGGAIDPAIVRDGVPLIREELAKIRSEAARGHYSFGGLTVADIAAGLVVVAGTDELWPDLTEFLLDPAVQRQDRTPALERLARADFTPPREVGVRFRQQAQQLLASAGQDLLETPINPYPAALRFLGAHGLIDTADLYDALAILAGTRDPDGRREAAVTVAALAAKAPRGELLALALPLANDSDVEVRANAARALALLARPNEPLATLARRRLRELLLEDGLLVPLHILRALADVPEGLLDPLRSQVADLADQHPARSVRAAARRLLESN